MSLAVIQICNLALSAIGEEQVQSLDDDNENARLCALCFEPSRDAVLRGYPWNRAMDRAQLASLTEAPAFGYDYQYELPVDCLRVFRLLDADLLEIEEYRVEGRKILCNAEAPVYLQFVKRLEDSTDMDPLLARAVAALLAHDISYRRSSSLSLRQTLWTAFEEALKLARDADAAEGPRDLVTGEDTWLAARG